MNADHPASADSTEAPDASEHIRHYKKLHTAAWGIAAALIVGFASFMLFSAILGSDDDDNDDPKPPGLSAVSEQLRLCASEPSKHTVADCDVTATQGGAALTEMVNHNPKLAGHRQRYLMTLDHHLARPNCAKDNPVDPMDLCRTDYLDLAVMASEADNAS